MFDEYLNEYDTDGSVYSNIELYHEALTYIKIDNIEYSGHIEIIGNKTSAFHGLRYFIFAQIISTDIPDLWNKFITHQTLIYRVVTEEDTEIKWKSFNTPSREIAENSDMNYLTAIGNYYCSSSEKAKTIYNLPGAISNGLAFTVEVESGVGFSNEFPKQTIKSYTNGWMFTRTYDNYTNKWTDWIQYITTIDTTTVSAGSFYGAGVLHHCNGSVHSISIRGTITEDLKAGTYYDLPTSGWCKGNGGAGNILLSNGVIAMIQINANGAVFNPGKDIPKGSWILGSGLVIDYPS
jgi:hypothetical protein